MCVKWCDGVHKNRNSGQNDDSESNDGLKTIFRITHSQRAHYFSVEKYQTRAHITHANAWNSHRQIIKNNTANGINNTFSNVCIRFRTHKQKNGTFRLRIALWVISRVRVFTHTLLMGLKSLLEKLLTLLE